MAVSHRTVIAFGMVAIPIGLVTATEDNDIHFNQLHKEDYERIRYKKSCPQCGKEVTSNDIIKGYEYNKDQYIVVSDDEIEKIKTEKEKSIEILHFANMNQISPVYYEKTYQAIPEPGGEKAFELLRKALYAEQKIAIGKTVMGTKGTLMALIPRENGILISTMYYHDEIKEIQKSYAQPEVSEAELNLAKMLIRSMDTPFAPENYSDEYQQKLKALIEAKINGKEMVAPAAELKGNIINLMDALKESVKQHQAPAGGRQYS